MLRSGRVARISHMLAVESKDTIGHLTARAPIQFEARSCLCYTSHYVSFGRTFNFRLHCVCLDIYVMTSDYRQLAVRACDFGELHKKCQNMFEEDNCVQ
eukprot:scaffold63354_cov36-Prasinocladus_malaysianus.AAC.1